MGPFNPPKVSININPKGLPTSNLDIIGIAISHLKHAGHLIKNNFLGLKIIFNNNE